MTTNQDIKLINKELSPVFRASDERTMAVVVERGVFIEHFLKHLRVTPAQETVLRTAFKKNNSPLGRGTAWPPLWHQQTVRLLTLNTADPEEIVLLPYIAPAHLPSL
jgi:DNA uptake protein ComE-like DNA-binding protein